MQICKISNLPLVYKFIDDKLTEQLDEMRKQTLNSLPSDFKFNGSYEENENRKLIGLTKTCLMNKLHFWVNKPGDHESRITYIERDIKKAVNICDRIEKKLYIKADIDTLKSILSKHNCLG